MKKIIIIVVLLVIAVCTYSIPQSFIKSNDVLEVRYYTLGNPTNAGTYMFDNVYMINDKNLKKVNSKNLVNVVGTDYLIEGDYDKFRDIISTYNIDVKKSEVVENIHIIYGVYEGACQPKFVDGYAVNIQIAIHDNVITVGTPLIMGSY